MATCPDCGGYLDDHHRCCGTRRFYARALVVAGLGVVIGVVGAFLMNTQPALALTIAMALLGAVVLTTGWLATL